MHTRKLVVPGELIAEDENIRLNPFLFRENGKIYSAVLGLLEIDEDAEDKEKSQPQKNPRIKVIPLAGRYIPKVGDFVVGVVTSVQNTLWILDIFSPYKAAMNEKDFMGGPRGRREIEDPEELKRLLPVGSVVYASVREISTYHKVFLTLGERPARVLKGGQIIVVSPVKVPRIIGKKNSMINMIKDESKCSIVVGQNGIVWMDGKEENIEIAVAAIREIETHSHVQGLTENIKKMINEMRRKHG